MVKNLARRFSFVTLIALCFVLFAACGKEKPEDSLRVLLKIPEGESADLFWFGVEKRELEVVNGEDKSVRPWNTGQAVEIDLREGDTLVFRAFDASGQLLIVGEAEVGKSKMVSIPLRRVL